MNSALITHSASFRNAFPYRLWADSWAASNFFLRAAGFAGATISCFPSVLTSRGVSGSILRRSRIGRSITNAKLFPCFVSFLTMRLSVLTMYHHKTPHEVQCCQQREPSWKIRFLGAQTVAPRHGFEPRFTAPKAAVLPLDDRGIPRKELRFSVAFQRNDYPRKVCPRTPISTASSPSSASSNHPRISDP